MGAPEAKATPKHKGNATRKTTILAEKSERKFVTKFFTLEDITCYSRLKWAFVLNPHIYKLD